MKIKFIGLTAIFVSLVFATRLSSEVAMNPPRPEPTPSELITDGDAVSSANHSGNFSPTPTPLIPRQEVKDGFTRFIPDDKGDMEWQLDGSTVKFISPSLLEITDMKAISLSPKIGYLTICAGKVLYDIDSQEAQADGERISVRRKNMVLTGSGFLWSPHLEQIRVYEDVKVLVLEKDNIGLFPL